MTSAEYCKIAVKALEDKKAEDVKVIDIREISPIADFFIHCRWNEPESDSGNA